MAHGGDNYSKGNESSKLKGQNCDKLKKRDQIGQKPISEIIVDHLGKFETNEEEEETEEQVESGEAEVGYEIEMVEVLEQSVEIW